MEDAVEEATGGKGSKAKLTQAVAQRWVTICFMLLRVLQRWNALGRVYMNCSTVFPLTGKRNEVRWGFSRVFCFYPKGSKECSRSVVVPVWSRSLQVAVHVFGKYSERVPHMTVKAHSASHKFCKVAACYSPGEI